MGNDCGKEMEANVTYYEILRANRTGKNPTMSWTAYISISPSESASPSVL